MKKRLTFISDTHNKHKFLDGFLPGGDILLCAGDISSRGYTHELEDFFEWYDGINNYDHKIFISGNHDFGFQDNPDKIKGLLTGYKTIDYLQDEYMGIQDGDEPELKIWGSPWQPEFHNWAFNLPRGEKIKEKWDLIPNDVDILITHGPAFGKLDYVSYNRINVGCEELLKKIEEVKPKLHISGHIHEGFGYIFNGETHFFNAAVLNDRYEFRNKPMTIDWDSETNTIEFVEG
jgi:predicted phosphodiesterase